MDGRLDGDDNCPNVANTDQTDTDSDMMGDACDTDDDGDTVLDTADSCPAGSLNAASGADADAGDACDIDDDNDGLIEIATAAELNNMRNDLAGQKLPPSR